MVRARGRDYRASSLLFPPGDLVHTDFARDSRDRFDDCQTDVSGRSGGRCSEAADFEYAGAKNAERYRSRKPNEAKPLEELRIRLRR